MNSYLYKIRKANDTFEPYSGIGYIKTGGSDVIYTVKSEDQSLDLYLDIVGYLRDDDGNIVGCQVLNRKENTITHLVPGKVEKIDVWTTVVDDDGCPEEICISYFLELIPYEQAPKDTYDF